MLLTYKRRPNRLREEYGDANGNSHPNSTANAYSTQVFATDPDNLLDRAWDAFVLGVADNVMPDSVIDRVAWASEIVQKRGRYPIQTS